MFIIHAAVEAQCGVVVMALLSDVQAVFNSGCNRTDSKTHHRQTLEPISGALYIIVLRDGIIMVDNPFSSPSICLF